MKADEPRYTLAEAREIIAKQTCAQVGHDLYTVNSVAGDPASIYCSRCAAKWKVTREK